MNAPTDWTSALVILAAGLVLGTMVIFITRRRKASATTKRSELEARRDALVRQLRELGDDVADDERTWLEKETADVLRALDRLPKGEAKPQPQKSATLGFVWGVACTLLLAGIAYYASTLASPTAQPTPNTPVTEASMQPATTMPDLPPDHPPLAMFESQQPPDPSTPSSPHSSTPSSNQPIHLTLSLDPSSPARGGIIYVIARGSGGGHPVAVRRIDTNDFPVTLDFGGSDDSMIGAPLPEKIRIEARLDSDGDAGTNDPADPHAFADNVRGGSAVELKLARAN